MHTTDTYKAKLLAEKRVLEEELAHLGSFNTETTAWEATPEPETSGPESDENDLADRFEDFEDRSAKIDVLSKRLEMVNAALDRIASGTYGICRISQSPIEPDRLEADPTADTCIAHKEVK
ncbi:MAG: hypothetical protein MUD00_00475 [Candidatus Pacebacteria bacterium]|jgi:RNA polymerase-binding transcription factor DksA|nr:hypothetical protein [Candidatus Paceibacterota bacterium]